MRGVRRLAIFLGIAAVIGVIGIIDAVTLPRLTILYLVPLIIAAARLGLPLSIVLAAVAEAVELAANLYEGTPFDRTLMISETSRFLVFLLVIFIIDRLVAELAKVRDLEQRRSVDLDLARSFQESLLAQPPSEFRNLLISGKHTFARELGGDYIYFKEVKGRLFFCIADISGKSIAAALFTAFLHHNLLELLDKYTDLDALMRELNGRLYRTLPDSMFVTMFCAEIGPDEIRFINAGHEPPLVYRMEQDAVAFLESSRPFVLGISPEFDYPIAGFPFKKGDVMLAVTDGVTDSPAFKDRPLEKLRAFLLENKNNRPDNIADGLESVVERATPELKDDMSIVCIRHV